jgi:hypothetical protein
VVYGGEAERLLPQVTPTVRSYLFGSWAARSEDGRRWALSGGDGWLLLPAVDAALEGGGLPRKPEGRRVWPNSLPVQRPGAAAGRTDVPAVAGFSGFS